jgi:hypothetical protein
MISSFIARRARSRIAAAACAGAAIALCAGPAAATRVGGGVGQVPAASAVRAAPLEPAHLQTDESASLRQGTIAAIDAAGARVQMTQGVWLALDPAKTQLVRNGQTAGLETLKVGEAIRFTIVADPGAPATMKVIYVP